MKPILKYRGGKSKEINCYSAYILPTFDTYYEPFFGGGATYFHLEPEKACIADVNKQLTKFYKELVSNYDRVKNELSELEKVYIENRKIFKKNKLAAPNSHVFDPNDELYYDIRDQYNRKKLQMYNLLSPVFDLFISYL